MESIMNAGSCPLSGLTMSSMDVKFPWDERSYELGIESGTAHLTPAQSDSNTPCPSSRPSHQGTSAYAVKLGVLRM